MHAINYFEENEKKFSEDKKAAGFAQVGPVKEGIILEKISPKGYIWAKVQRCWTGSASSHRFFPEAVHARTGLSMPAAYVATVIAYDPYCGYHERKIKLQGYEAILAEQHWHDDEGRSALISCEGHVVQHAWTDASGAIHCEHMIIVKLGMLTIHQYSPDIKADQPEPTPLPAYVDPVQQEHGTLIEFECLEDDLAMDDSPF